MTLPKLDGLQVKKAELDVFLVVTHKDPVELKAGRRNHCDVVLPAELMLTYLRTPRSPQWSAGWLIRGRKRLKRGTWSEHVAAYVNEWDVDQAPDWVAAALLAHHPDPDQVRDERSGESL